MPNDQTNAKDYADKLKTELLELMLTFEKRREAEREKAAAERKKDAVEFKKLKKLIGDHTRKSGTVVEQKVQAFLDNSKTVGNYKFDVMLPNVPYQVNKQDKTDFDAVLLNGTVACLVSVKTDPRTEAVDKLISTELIYFKKNYPNYKEYICVIAGEIVSERTTAYAAEKGVYVIKDDGKSFAEANLADFVPAIF